MRRLSIRKIWAVGKCEYKKFLTDPRNIVIVCFFIVLYDSILKEFIQMSEEMGQPIHILEPFIALCGTGFVTVVLPIVFLLIISDFPKISGNDRFYMIRTGKYNWIFGQILSTVMMIITYMGVTFGMTCVLAAPYSYVSNEWSDVVTKYYIMFPDESMSAKNELINGTLYNQTTPVDAFLATFILFSLLLLLISLVCLISFLCSVRKLGLCFCALAVALGGALTTLNLTEMWIFPVAHIMTWKHYQEIFSEPIFPISWSFWYFILLILVCFIGILNRVPHKNFDEIEE